MEDAAKIWLDDAQYDIGSAAAMLKAGRYFYVVFMCHLTKEYTAAVLAQTRKMLAWLKKKLT